MSQDVQGKSEKEGAASCNGNKITQMYPFIFAVSLVHSNSLIIIAAHKSIIITSIMRQTEDNLETRFVCHHDNDKQCIKSRYIGWYFQYQIEIRRGLAERKPISMLLLWISLGLGGP